MKRVIAGEGTYGCVHKPSIPCKTPPIPGFSYDNYVSKIMTDRHARTELEEFLIMGKYDKSNKYHLGEPILCKPKLNSETIDDINKCDNIKIADREHTNKYSLLIIKDGGPDLKNFCKKHIDKYLSTDKQNKSDIFWLEVLHLFKGLKFFRDNNLVHNDLKPQNILFDMSRNKLMCIDFGLMRRRSEIITSSNNNTNNLGVIHWSYPLECGFMNQSWFNEYKKQESEKIIQDEIQDLILNVRKKSRLSNFKHPDSFDILFSYIDENNLVPNSSIIQSYLHDFYLGMKIYKYQDDYDMFLADTTDSIDIYGLGFTLKYVLNCFKRHRAISNTFYVKATELFRSMYSFNLKNRQLNIDVLIDSYKNILGQSGVLARLNKNSNNSNSNSNRNRNILDEMPISSNRNSNRLGTQLSTKIDNIGNLNPVELGSVYKSSDKQLKRTIKERSSSIPLFSTRSITKKRRLQKKHKNRNITRNGRRRPKTY